MNAYETVTWLMVTVTLVTLLWRVWRLESAMKCSNEYSAWLRDCLNDRVHKSGFNELWERFYSLAHALGYEWKSTPTKSGWERKHPLSNVCCVSTPLRSDKWGWLDEQPNDRRKADRRKPVDAPKKKPKRATH